MILLAILFLFVLAAIPAQAVTLEWPCNVESDMKDYRVEYAAEPSYAWGVVATIEHIDGCESIQYPDARYLTPGRKRYRVFSGNDSGHYSTPSPEAWITIPVSPIGNPGGQSEHPLPASPHESNAQIPPIVPPPVVPPPVVLPPVPPVPPVPAVTLRDALKSGLATCLKGKLAHTACMKALDDAIGKVNP
ncbi:MAG: hypothetical protein HQL97_00410 [Magnetococcales bacterium]|nr:hypothetical protein [Magnetococcales bacterium]